MRDYGSTVKNLREAAKGLLFDAIPYRASVMRDAADAIEELFAKVPKWISVEERLPEPRTVVLLYSHEGTFVGYMHDDKRFTVYASSYPERPTHWMPLPEAPKEVER